MGLHLSQSDLIARLGDSISSEIYSVFNDVPYILVDLDDNGAVPLYHPGCPVIAVADGRSSKELVDIFVESEEEAQDVFSSIQNRPLASAMLVQLLRHNENVSIEDALFAESLSFSTLQHGEEFLNWFESRQKREAKSEPHTPPIIVEREDDVLKLTLNRPDKRNAWSSAMRDALCEALHLAISDTSITTIELRGNGPAFGAGGDLNEFGQARDASIAHVSRMVRSAGALMNAVRDRMTVFVHGACVGAGIELPAFASKIISRKKAFFQLPEVQMGLVPGAGGTASILRRIGRHRLAKLAITGERISATTALEWGLVDQLINE